MTQGQSIQNSTPLVTLQHSLSIALVPAQVAEVLADLPMRCYSTPAATAQLRAALARLEGEQPPPADCIEHRSLEALRLEDPTSMSGCWNPGYAAALSVAGDEGFYKAHMHPELEKIQVWVSVC